MLRKPLFPGEEGPEPPLPVPGHALLLAALAALVVLLVSLLRQGGAAPSSADAAAAVRPLDVSIGRNASRSPGRPATVRVSRRRASARVHVADVPSRSRSRV